MGWSAPVRPVLPAPKPLETAPYGIGAARASPIQTPSYALNFRFSSRISAFPLSRRCVRRRAMAFPPLPCQTSHRHRCPWRVRLPGGQLPHCSPRRCFPDHNAESPQQPGAAGRFKVSRACMSSDGCDALSTSASSCWCSSLSFPAGASSASLSSSIPPPSSSSSLSSLLSLSLRARRAATLLRRAGGRRRSDLLVSLGLAPARLRRRL